MSRLQRATRACHLSCSELISADGLTIRQQMKFHGMEHLAKCGWRDAKKWLDKKRMEHSIA